MERASRIKQIKIYVGKCFRLFFHERGWKNFISSAIIAVIICFVNNRDNMFTMYLSTRNGFFALVCACVWIGIFNSIQSICKERDIIKREHRSGLHISSYVVSHMVFESVLCFVESIIVTGIFCGYYHANLPADGVILPAVVELWITFFLIIFSSDALGLMVSSIVKTPNTAMTVMPFVLILQLVLSGFIFELKGVAEKVAYTTIAKWGINALCISTNVNSYNVPQIPYAPDKGEFLFGKLGDQFPIRDVYTQNIMQKNLDAYESTAGNFLMNLGILVGFIVLYMVISIIALEFVDKDKR